MKLYKWLYGIAVLLIAVFAVMLAVDYHTYVTVIGSAPYYAYVLIRAVEFLLPAVLLALAAWLFHQRNERK